jgi:hypothetical protein
MQRAAVKVAHPLGLVGHHQRLLAHRVLRGDTRRAFAGVAALRLDAAQRHHETAPRIAPVGAQRHQPHHVEGAHHLAGRAYGDAAAQVHADQCVVHQQQAFLQRRAHVVGELDRRRACATFSAVHHDEVGRDAGLQHGLHNRKPLPRVADAELEAGRLAA